MGRVISYGRHTLIDTNRLGIILALSVIMLSSGFLSFSARTFHVDPNPGSNKNDGSIDTGGEMATDHSVIIKNPSDFFVDYPRFDLRLKPGCAAIDSGAATLAPLTDIIGTARPQGGRIDIGAYEYLDGQQVRRSADAGSPTPEPYVVSVNRRGRSAIISIFNTTPATPLFVRIANINGQAMQEYVEHKGRILTCLIENPAAGIKIISIRNAQTSRIQTIFIR